DPLSPHSFPAPKTYIRREEETPPLVSTELIRPAHVSTRPALPRAARLRPLRLLSLAAAIARGPRGGGQEKWRPRWYNWRSLTAPGGSLPALRRGSSPRLLFGGCVRPLLWGSSSRKAFAERSMASEDVVGKTTGESAVTTIVNLAEEAKLAREGVKAPGHAILTICKSLAAGGVAGGVSRTAVAPLERLKILLQWYFVALSSADWKWNFFHLIHAEDAELTPVLRLGAGACAGIIAMSATYPMDMVRGRITVQTEKSPYQYRGMFHALTTVYRQEGFRALYKGWLPSVIGVVRILVSVSVFIPSGWIVPYVGLNFAVYESLKDWLVKSKPFRILQDNELSVTTRLACGAAAGTVGQTVAYPLDVIRRRMQMVGWKDAAPVLAGQGSKGSLEYNGMIDAFRKTVRNEGFGALYKGLVPNSVKVVPSIAIAFVTYEVVKDVLGVEMRISD
ncbi:hypothetical protein Taro_027433, partial [Colocasia esculenta]|nr:hypothetical protein [Colocasia esculenta]